MRPHQSALDTASDFSIAESRENATRFRIGELSEVQTKNSALGRCIASQVDSGENTPAKCREQHSNRSMFRGLIPPHPKAPLAEGIYDAYGHVVTPTKTGERQAGILNCASVNGTGITAEACSPWYASSMAFHGIREVCSNDR
jgi:hypothetical protein